jgi:hypothetical protein
MRWHDESQSSLLVRTHECVKQDGTGVVNSEFANDQLFDMGIDGFGMQR